MERTLFAGLTVLDPGESVETDNASFKARNPLLIDRLLEIGAVTHRHDAHAKLNNPAIAPSASAVASGGSIPAQTALYIGYTVHDTDQGESTISPLVTLTTELPLEPPSHAPSGAIDYTGGGLTVDTYYYAVSFLDAQGGETPIGDAVPVEREPGFPSARVQISGLSALLAESGAAAWRLWRAVGGGDFFYIASGAVDTYTDSGGSCVDCSLVPVPDNQNFTNGDNSVVVIVPSGAPMASASGFSVYMSTDPAFQVPSRMGTYPKAQANTQIVYRDLNAEDHVPPDVSTCIPGASKIDPDRELLDWHWKRPVATSGALPSAEAGDVRVALDTMRLWGASAAHNLGPAGWQGLGTLLTASDGHAHTVANVNELQFLGSAGADVTVTPLGGGVARVLVTASGSGTQGPAGPSGAQGPPGPQFFPVAASGDGSVASASAIMFRASAHTGSGAVTVASATPGPSAVVTIAFPQPGGHTDYANNEPAWWDNNEGQRFAYFKASASGASAHSESGFGELGHDTFDTNSLSGGRYSFDEGSTANLQYDGTGHWITTPAAGGTTHSYDNTISGQTGDLKNRQRVREHYANSNPGKAGPSLRYSGAAHIVAGIKGTSFDILLWTGTGDGVQKATVARTKPANDADVWIEVERRGNTIWAREWRTNPGTSPNPSQTPTYEISYDLAGGEVATYGTAAAAQSGHWQNLNNVDTQQDQVDDFYFFGGAPVSVADARHGSAFAYASGASASAQVVVISDEGNSDFLRLDAAQKLQMKIGSATVPFGNTPSGSASVAHGLPRTPSKVILTPIRTGTAGGVLTGAVSDNFGAANFEIWARTLDGGNYNGSVTVQYEAFF